MSSETKLVVPLAGENHAKVTVEVWVCPALLADSNEAIAEMIADDARKKIYDAVLHGRPDTLR